MAKKMPKNFKKRWDDTSIRNPQFNLYSFPEDAAKQYCECRWDHVTDNFNHEEWIEVHEIMASYIGDADMMTKEIRDALDSAEELQIHWNVVDEGILECKKKYLDP